MKMWQVGLFVLLLSVFGFVIILYSPGERIVEQRTLMTPLPTSLPTPTPEKGTVTLLFAGDIMLSRSVGDFMSAHNDWIWPFRAVASATRAADLMFANLETTISTRSSPHGCGYCFRSDPRSLQGLLYAGVDVVSIANNHIWDYGLPALEDTLGYLASGEIGAVGSGHTLSDARGPLVRTVNGTRIAYLAYTDILPASAKATEIRAGANLYDPDSMTADIQRARTMADVVVVSFHTGTEYQLHHNAVQERIYHSAIDAGADLVVGHHPHVVQDIERYKGKWIAYSLGNFIFDQNWSEQTRKGALLQVTVTDGAIATIATRSVDISKQYQASVHF